MQSNSNTLPTQGRVFQGKGSQGLRRDRRGDAADKLQELLSKEGWQEVALCGTGPLQHR